MQCLGHILTTHVLCYVAPLNPATHAYIQHALCCRSVLRSAYGVANTLRKMKRGQEAYEAWQVLFQYNREW